MRRAFDCGCITSSTQQICELCRSECESRPLLLDSLLMVHVPFSVRQCHPFAAHVCTKALGLQRARPFPYDVL